MTVWTKYQDMPEVSKGYSLSHAHKFYKKKTGSKIEKALYREICCAFNKALIADALEGRVVKLPHSMGSMWVKKYQADPENPPIDLNASKLAGKKIYHLNFHSDGYAAKWVWSKRNNLVTNLIYYSFHATRANSRSLAKVMKQPEGHKRFFGT